MNIDLAAQVRSVLWVIAYVVAYVGPFIFLYGVYLLVSMPLRRRERARLLLHLLELGAADGRTPERALIQAAASRDRALGGRFYQLAAYLESGMRLDQALASVPRIVPPEIAAMIRAGAELGDIRRVLPACQQWLNDPLSQTRGALNYVVVLGFIVLPVVPVMFGMAAVFVLPKFELIMQDLGGGGLPALTQAVFSSRFLLVGVPILLMLFFQALIFFYVAGPRGREMATAIGLGRISDWLLWALPWRRNRMKRDFTTMLSLLLDAGVPEPRAVTLAARSAANRRFQARVARMQEQLAGGTKLVDALAALDDRGELRWRMGNASHSRQGFFNALNGWLQALDARAFQQEQTAAHVLTTALVFVNGACIGLFVTAMFLALIKISEEAPLW
jgi:type II secretory pathway component PulF